MLRFGTSGIRDIAPLRVSPQLALSLACVLAKPAKNLPWAKAPSIISVGFDGRRSGYALKSAFISGALGAGANVYDLGICATPTLALHCQKTSSWGVMVTASHNPPQYNGIKVFFAGHEIPDSWEREVERQLGEALQNPYKAGWMQAGQVQQAAEEANSAHLRLILSKIGVSKIRKIKPCVVVDCANSAATTLMPKLLFSAGCKVIAINASPGEPYGRELEPKKESLRALSLAVRKHHALLGIAHDGDADRAVICDEKGNLLGLDIQLVLAASDHLASCKDEGKKVIVSTVESSLALRETCLKAGASLAITPVGSRYVAQAVRLKGAIFGGEPCGEYIFANSVSVPDGLMAGLYFTSLACRRGPLSVLAKNISHYPILRQKIACPSEKKEKAMKIIEKDWPFFEPSKIDGLRSDFEDGWVLVRPSGTESCIRITIEAKSRKKLYQRLEAIRAIVERAVRLS
jgi:phosphomannomutase